MNKTNHVGYISIMSVTYQSCPLHINHVRYISIMSVTYQS